MKPIRVQLRRAKGWRMPPNTVKVDRTTRFGNPFRAASGCTTADAVRHYTYLLGGYICLSSSPSIDEQRTYLKMLKAEKAKGWPALRGKNLACWCPLDKPCHADILLKIANRKTRLKVAA
jgi:hypothetical protein